MLEALTIAGAPFNPALQSQFAKYRQEVKCQSPYWISQRLAQLLGIETKPTLAGKGAIMMGVFCAGQRIFNAEETVCPEKFNQDMCVTEAIPVSYLRKVITGVAFSHLREAARQKQFKSAIWLPSCIATRCFGVKMLPDEEGVTVTNPEATSSVTLFNAHQTSDPDFIASVVNSDYTPRYFSGDSCPQPIATLLKATAVRNGFSSEYWATEADLNAKDLGVAKKRVTGCQLDSGDDALYCVAQASSKQDLILEEQEERQRAMLASKLETTSTTRSGVVRLELNTSKGICELLPGDVLSICEGAIKLDLGAIGISVFR